VSRKHREEWTSGLEPRKPWHVAVTPNIDMREKKTWAACWAGTRRRKNDSRVKGGLERVENKICGARAHHHMNLLYCVTGEGGRWRA
jgi:hypothetical protein